MGIKELENSIQYIHDFCCSNEDCTNCILRDDKHRKCKLLKSFPDSWEVEEWLG